MLELYLFQFVNLFEALNIIFYNNFPKWCTQKQSFKNTTQASHIVFAFINGEKETCYDHSLHTFRLSGSSDRPAYPGFIVIKTAHVGSSFSSVPSNTRSSVPALMPVGTTSTMTQRCLSLRHLRLIPHSFVFTCCIDRQVHYLSGQ